ncbi:MAG: response regulator [Candidatus Marithrix sp.]
MNIFNNFKVGTKISLGFATILILMIAMGTTLLLSLEHLKDGFILLVEHDQPILSNAHKLAKLIVDMETGERGFLITGKEEFLEPFNAGIIEFNSLLATEKKLVGDNQSQIEVFNKIIQLHNDWLEQAAYPEISKRREVNKATVTAKKLQEIIQAGIGKNILDNLRGILAQLETNLRTRNDLEGIILIIKIAKNMVDQETGERGFIITGADNFLEPYHAGRKQLATNIINLNSHLTGTNDLALLEQIKSLTKQWIEQAAKLEISARREMDANSITMTDVTNMVQAGTGKNILDAIRIQFDKLIQTEEQLNLERSSDVKNNVIFMNNIAIWLIIISILISVVLGITISRNITYPLQKLIILANNILMGNMKQIAGLQNHNEIKQIRRDEIGEIEHSFYTIADYFKNIIDDVIQISKGLAKGQQITTEVEYQGDFIQIKTSLETASSKLMKATAQNSIQNWIKNGQTSLNEIIQGEQEIFTTSKKIISFLTTYVDAQIGLFYLLKEEEGQQYLQLIASYAYIQDDKLINKLPLTEGLAGQAALEKKVILRIQTPEECPPIIVSGLARSLPKYILLLPFLYENKVKGVIEIGATATMTDIQRNFLEQIMPNIGIAINTANSSYKMQILLQQSQQQAKELQTQQERLQESNGELQSQSEELQTQQEELRESNETLEERTQDLEHQKIKIQEKNQALEISKIEMEKAKIAMTLKAEELELASKYKSEFLANMSHELRTPLNSLLILSQLLADNHNGNLDVKQVEYAETINSAGNDLLTLINDILDLSKVEAGKVEMQWGKISLTNLLASIEQKFSPIANDKGVGFQLNIENDIPSTLVTDSQRVKQIINNLLSNAFKFTSKGEVKLIVQYPIKLPAIIEKLKLKNPIAISVIDNGIGIPQNKQQTIFEAFQQEDGSTSRRYGGTGLGLSISRQLARLLGGELTLVSEKDKGSTFTLYLPNKDSSQIPNKVQHVTQTDSTLLTTEYQSPKEVLRSDDRDNLSSSDITILIIEDDRKFSNIIIELAKAKGFKCLLAEDGLIGLELAEEYVPDAIILDIGLPKMDGLTLMRKLKDKSSTRHIPVHFMSASDQTIDAKKMGAIGYLIKPINMEKLIEAFKKIERFLSKTVKTLLIVADSKPNQQRIMDLVTSENLQVEVSITGEDACKKILSTNYDCVILDMDLEQGSGGKLLEKMHQETGQPCKIPIIAYSDRDLTTEEEALLLRCSNKMPIKSVSSPENLVDETTLFLHQIEANLPGNKRKMLHMVHDKKTILKNKKILIIDDDERNIFALATILENNEVEVICGLNGKEGLEILRKNNDIAIVLMDIMMPEMDGYETIREIRKQAKYRNLPIIALTAKAMKDDRIKCIEAGANDYLAKPVDTDKLLSLMRVWLYR